MSGQATCPGTHLRATPLGKRGGRAHGLSAAMHCILKVKVEQLVKLALVFWHGCCAIAATTATARAASMAGNGKDKRALAAVIGVAGPRHGRTNISVLGCP